ncbi:microtubule-associated protein 1S-like [Lacerta agilis]|uniref:microtubule-associated protein 1S-like n=1 Tax=Lacerta agilis TaxID=80427 RepID=UPI0014196E4C|nr:microtubule-associated protein 1S-like [Lacerta agilis]
MAAGAAAVGGGGGGAPLATPAAATASAEARFSLVVVFGAGGGRGGLRTAVLRAVRDGIRSWDIDLTACNLDQQLKLFVSRHSATFSDIVKGQRGSAPSGRHPGDNGAAEPF